MNTFTNSKKTKKFILALVVLILFSFCYPKNVKAFGMDDIVAAPAKIFWYIEEGVLIFLNNIFTNNANRAIADSDADSEGNVTTEIFVKLTPENIIKGKFILFDANIFKEITKDQEYYDMEVDSSGNPTGAVAGGKTILRETISGWYYALRNFAIVALLSVLVYVGIRMIISTVAQDKAKYKVMFKDWLVALCLVVIMHYLMIGILNFSSLITESLGSGGNSDMIGTLTRDITGILSGDSYEYTINGETMDISDAYAKLIVLGGVIIYTFIFAFKYLKREFTIIFLILLGPVSCITYPIDKISDGKAQAFNKWFSEFLYQIIVQPFHLLLYIVLVGTATELANANVLYSLVCFAVMIPAEKFIKEMFGFKDKLGSPLGAFAGGALASKAINSLMSKGKGSGSSGKGDGDDNSSTPNELPPKTVDKPGLVDGSDSGEGIPEDTGGLPIGQGENEALESGEEPGGGASAAAAYQNSDDPIGDAERAALEEQLADGQIDESDLTDEQRALLGIGGDTEQDPQGGIPTSQENPEDTQTTAGETMSNNEQSKLDKLRAIHNQRMSKKWGSTNKGQRWKRRILKGAKAGAKGILKGGAIGLLGAAAVSTAIMTGNGKEALGIAAGIGAYAGKTALSGGKKLIKGATGAVKDYRNAFRSYESKEKKALEAFKSDSKQIDKAVLSYRENHNGQDPSYEALEREMEDRFALSRYGLSDDLIDRAVGSYQDLRETGISDNDALNQTVYATKLANDYSKKDFRSEKTMKEAISTISQNFEKYGVSKQVAEANARKYLTQAAGIKGTEIALPSNNQTIDVPIEQRLSDVSSSLGIRNPNLSTIQLERMNNITVRLHNAGFSSREIEQIASSCTGGSTTQILDKYEAKVEYLNDGNAQEQARMFIEARNNGRNATARQVQTEMRERLILRSTFDVSRESDISALRDMEATELKGKTQIQAAREFAREHKGRLKDEAHITRAREDLIEKLKAGGSSRDKARKDAENIINLAGQYNNEI